MHELKSGGRELQTTWINRDHLMRVTTMLIEHDTRARVTIWFAGVSESVTFYLDLAEYLALIEYLPDETLGQSLDE